MEYTYLGKTREKISVIGLGFWQAGSHSWGGTRFLKDIRDGIEHALALGFNFYDTAEVYGAGKSEELLGNTIGNNDSVLIATKTPGFRVTREDIVKAAEKSRRRLRRDAIDLLQYHWPPPIYNNLCEVIRGLEDTIDKGLTRYIGVSNFNKKLIEKAMECLHKHDIVSNQVQYSLAYRSIEQGLKQYMEKEKIATIAWSPLAKGGLAGKKKMETIAQKTDTVFRETRKNKLLQKTLEETAMKHETTKSVIALRWLIEKNAIPIPGYRKKQRVEEYYKATKISLSKNEVEKLDSDTRFYVTKYGDYHPFTPTRFIPSFIQKILYFILDGF